jgi:predicted ATPase
MGKLGRLQHIKLEGFRSIRQLDLDLGPLNILIGPHGAGKSNFISFFKFMNKLQEKELQLHVRTQLNGADRTLYFGRKTTSSIKINLHFPPNSYGAELVPTTDDGLVFARETAWFHGDEIGYQGGQKAKPLAQAGDLESALPAPGRAAAAQHVARHISDWKVYHFHDTSDTAKVKGTYSLFANGRLMPQGDNLAAFLHGIQSQHQDAYKKIVSTIQ